MIMPLVTLVAEIVSVDRVTNETSAVNIVDTIQTQGFPVFFRRVSFLCILTREMSDPATLEVDLLVTLNGGNLATARHKLNFDQGTVSKDIVRMDGFVIPQPGTLLFNLAGINGVSLTKYSIPVTALPPIAVATAGTAVN